jgi:predicted NBD/HSP70 family sugar kinase
MLAGIVNILNLDMYVLGGGVVSAWDAYAPKMFEELRARSLVYAATAPDDLLADDLLANDPLGNDPVTNDPLMTSRPEESGASLQQESSRVRKTIITRAQLGSDAGLYGAARVACLLS